MSLSINVLRTLTGYILPIKNEAHNLNLHKQAPKETWTNARIGLAQCETVIGDRPKSIIVPNLRPASPAFEPAVDPGDDERHVKR